MNTLGIETSCDETAAAIYNDRDGLKSNIIASQKEHEIWGGVVPEIASRAHDEKIIGTVNLALDEAGLSISDIDRIAVTQGPGLVGALLVGLCFTKGLSLQRSIPFTGVNHIDAHVYANFIEHKPEYPFISLVVSGGHTQLSKVDAPFSHQLLGKTRDDAAGEAFDKTGKLLGLPYPAGPEMDRLAQKGNPKAFKFPKAMLKSGFDFSYSGLKTSVLYRLRDEHDDFIRDNLADLCASIVNAITEVLVKKIQLAVAETGIKTVLIAGGVSANSIFRRKLNELRETDGIDLYIPSPVYCTDNAAMIAITGHLMMENGTYGNLEMQPFTRYRMQHG